MEEKNQLDRGSCEEDLLRKVDREKRGREKSAVGGSCEEDLLGKVDREKRGQEKKRCWG